MNTNDLPLMTPNCEYTEYESEVQKVRDCIEGSAKIKREGYKYLPHPSSALGKNITAAQEQRYTQYLFGAEFDGQPEQTLQTLLGKHRFTKTDVDLPSKVDYLVDDSDGDGMSLVSAIEYAVSNVYQVKFQVVICDYKGLTNADTNVMKIAEKEELKPKAVFKQYKRENVIDWSFKRINGVMQLCYLLLLERETQFDRVNRTHTLVHSYIELGLDDDGNYYQRKILRGAGTGDDEGEYNYPKVGGQFLKYIPCEIITDQEMPSGHMPKGAGFLGKICDAALYKYRQSADYKETMRNLAPTLITKGWKNNDIELFKEINGGRDYIQTGTSTVNNLPNNVDYDILSIDTSMQPFEWYFTYADKKILSMGGTAKQEMANMTATEADINASEQNALLMTVADNAEKAFKRLVNYALMFEGVIKPDNVMQVGDDVKIDLPRDFATPKLTVEEVRVIYEGVALGVKTKEQAAHLLAQGGWDYQDAETTIAELEESPPSLNLDEPTRTGEQEDTEE